MKRRPLRPTMDLVLALLILLRCHAAFAQSELGQDRDFERDKVTYIKRYAWPMRSRASESERLFSPRETGRPRPSGETAPQPTPDPASPPPAETPYE